MKKLSLASALVSLVFCVACGSSGIGGLIGTGHFSNASLNGTYVYQISGLDPNSGDVYGEGGVFTANGTGTITSGVDDISETAGSAFGSATTGSYSISSDGTGNILLNNTGFGAITLSITMVSTNKAYLIEADPLNSTGVIEKQSVTTLPGTATPFVFKQHGVSNTQDFSIAGQFTLATDGTITGSDDVDRNGTINNGAGTANPLALSAGSLLAAPDATGRGTGTIIDPSGTFDFIYYIVDANNIRFVISDTGVGGIGRAEVQTGGPFSTDPLVGKSFAFGSRADDNTGLGAVNTVGSFSVDSGGALTGMLDSVQDNNSFASVPISAGSYTAVGANGRTVVSLTNAIPSSVHQIFWMVNPSRAFFLTTSDTGDLSKIEDGTADEQAGTFNNASLTGQYAFTMDGFDLNAQFDVDRVGWIQWDGSGKLTWNEAVNNSGNLNTSGGLSGTYAVASNGRATASVNNLSYNNNDIVFYLVSGSNAYILENDPGVEINGVMNKQSQ
jgi:hypothetical protein